MLAIARKEIIVATQENQGCLGVAGVKLSTSIYNLKISFMYYFINFFLLFGEFLITYIMLTGCVFDWQCGSGNECSNGKCKGNIQN